MELLQQIREMACQAGAQNNCRLYDVYRHRDRVQVFIDKPSDNRGVTAGDCENVFHSLAFLLRAECPELLKNHRLEVSSPGLNRKLREKWHFEESVGLEIKVILFHPVAGVDLKTGKESRSLSFSGILKSFQGDVLRVCGERREWRAPFSEVKTAQAVSPGLFQKKEKPRGGAKRSLRGRNT